MRSLRIAREKGLRDLIDLLIKLRRSQFCRVFQGLVQNAGDRN
jgi:hypothetical protein